MYLRILCLTQSRDGFWLFPKSFLVPQFTGRSIIGCELRSTEGMGRASFLNIDSIFFTLFVEEGIFSLLKGYCVSVKNNWPYLWGVFLHSLLCSIVSMLGFSPFLYILHYCRLKISLKIRFCAYSKFVLIFQQFFG